MKKNISILIACLMMCCVPGKLLAQWGNTGDVQVTEQSVRKVDSLLQVDLKICLTDLSVKSNLAVDIIPVLTGENGQSTLLPKLLVTGRNRHIVFQRMPRKEAGGLFEVRRRNKEEQYADYTASIPYEKWMGHSSLSVVLDLCGSAGMIWGANRWILGISSSTIRRTMFPFWLIWFQPKR